MCLGGISGNEQHAMNAADQVIKIPHMKIRKTGQSHHPRRRRIIIFAEIVATVETLLIYQNGQVAHYKFMDTDPNPIT